MTIPEDDLLPISALQHLLFCERQCALIHVDRIWAENLWTAQGRLLHEKAHNGKSETRDGIRITHGLPLRSLSLGLIGQADVVEWEPPTSHGTRHKAIAKTLQGATRGERNEWRINPVEYKRGKPKANDCDRVQLCAQAMCLEEMLEVSISTGELFYGEKRRRVAVTFDTTLRETTTRAAGRLHEMVQGSIMPPAVREKKCETCSLFHHCLPDVTSLGETAREYLARMLKWRCP